MCQTRYFREGNFVQEKVMLKKTSCHTHLISSESGSAGTHNEACLETDELCRHSTNMTPFILFVKIISIVVLIHSDSGLTILTLD